ncbi:hypothetical protein TNCV_1540951 [Trichonephila clavipes]|nr:hypothetical protein TNCV_1540951 [Trichonephila clavipes]
MKQLKGIRGVPRSSDEDSTQIGTALPKIPHLINVRTEIQQIYYDSAQHDGPGYPDANYDRNNAGQTLAVKTTRQMRFSSEKIWAQ